MIKNNYFIIGFISLGFFTLLSYQINSPDIAQDTPKTEERSVDTYIPSGHVLVPLEIANSESLATILGSFGGVVDLYLATNAGQKSGQKVGSKLKLLRAPLNPNQYAVLIRENESQRLLSYTGPFIAVVQNPKEKGNQVKSSRSQIKIEYQN